MTPSLGLLRSVASLRQLLQSWRWLALAIGIASVGAVSTESSAQALDLRVAIRKGANTIQVGSSTAGVVKDAGGRVLGNLEALVPLNATVQGNQVSLGNWRASQLVIEPSGSGVVWIGDRWYHGKVRLLRQGDGVTAVNVVNIEEYLYSVVGSEAIPTWPLEALKAQAVAARTYAIYQSKKGGNRFFDLDTTTATQVYKGLNNEYVSTVEAVQQTEGQVMTYQGKVILAAFHAASGGHTENVEDVWMSPLPYLRGVVDYDQASPVFQWNRSFTPSELSQQFGGVGTIQSLQPLQRTPQGRVITLRIIGSQGSKNLSGAKVREVLKLRSTRFDVTQVNGSFSLLGWGSGHGIGLSQWGAYGLAQQGVAYSQILAHYYQNTRLSQLNVPSLSALNIDSQAPDLYSKASTNIGRD